MHLRLRFGLCLVAAFPASAAEVQFNRDVRPILSENCFSCHGPAKQKSGLRLDVREVATKPLESGSTALIPGQPDASELVKRILATDPDDAMPPADSGHKLTAAQKETLRRWIAEGAKYQGHWAFQPIERPPVPAARANTSGNEIDRFIRARLTAEKLPPAPPAAPGVWLRRVSLDLIGLPPTVAEVERFEADAKSRGEKAYADAVERLLASAHFGERTAMDWLDAARYADTHGFNNDSARSMWRWRDWVISAFNRNQPYDQFITEQLAGDLLPKPTLEQRIATGFGRNHVINSEGGIIDEEYRVEYVADRVKTMSTAWLGLTMECARCHDHKFDPITQKDYYRLFAFFNNVPEQGEDGRIANAAPLMAAPTTEQQAELARLSDALARFDAQLQPARAAWTWDAAAKTVLAERAKAAQTASAAEKGVVMWLEAKPPSAAAPKKGAPAASAATTEPDDPAPASGVPARKIAAANIDFSNKEGLTVAFWLRPAADNPRDVPLFSSLNYATAEAAAGYGSGRELRLIDGELELRLCVRLPAYALIVRTSGAHIAPGESRHVALTYSGGRKAEGVRFFIDGVEVPTVVSHDDLIGEPGKRDYLLGADTAKPSGRFAGEFDDARAYPRVLAAESLRALFHAQALPLATSAADEGHASTRQRAWLADASLAQAAATRDLVAEREKLLAEHLALRRSLPTVMVMVELPSPRPAFLLQRGRYDSPGEPVQPDVPAILGVGWPSGAPRNRLGLARWLTDPRHPLTARVVVNRFWAQFFGLGLVKTLEDFGSQGEWPSHPELLDWLARDFVDGGWNVKSLVRQIVLSATYRQSSAASPEALARDPENRLLSHSPRLRLPAELIRDQALALSGLLTPRIGGPSVYPYQPDKLYAGLVVEASYPGTTWGRSGDADLYRRSLYTFWKRTVPHPVMTTFDAPDREFCTVRRSRTNTPLQALILWNEPGLVEAGRRFATRILREAPGDDAARLAWAFEAGTGRRAQPAEVAVLLRMWDQLRADYAAAPADAKALLQTGASAPDESLPLHELAAMTALANVLLSLDEVITKN